MAYQIIDGNMQMFKGDTSTIPLTFNIDITGLTAVISAKVVLSDTTFALKVQNSTHDDPTNGITHVSLAHSDTNIDAKSYFMDICLIKYDTDGTTILEQNTIFPAVSDKTAYLIILDHPEE